MQAVSVKVGEKVLLPEYGGTKIVLDDKVKYINIEEMVGFFFSVINDCFLFLITRTISCSVMEISLENTLNEASCLFVVVFFFKKMLSPSHSLMFPCLIHVRFF